MPVFTAAENIDAGAATVVKGAALPVVSSVQPGPHVTQVAGPAVTVMAFTASELAPLANVTAPMSRCQPAPEPVRSDTGIGRAKVLAWSGPLRVTPVPTAAGPVFDSDNPPPVTVTLPVPPESASAGRAAPRAR